MIYFLFVVGITWLQGNAEMLPVKDNSYDVYTVAFGIRNMTHIDKVQMYAVCLAALLCISVSYVSVFFR